MLQTMKIELVRTDSMGALGLSLSKDGMLKIENADGRIRRDMIY